MRISKIMVGLLLITSIIGCQQEKISTRSLKTEIKETVDESEEEIEDIEQYIYSLFDGENTTMENTIKIIKVLPQIDWRKYDEVTGDSSLYIIDWLFTVDQEIQYEYIQYLFNLKDLDAAYAESYSAIVGKLFLNDKRRMIKELSKVDDKKIERISPYIAYYCDYFDLKSIREETKLLLNVSDLSDKEKDVIHELIIAFDTPR